MKEWLHGAVIYQTYPRSLQDSSGEGIGNLPSGARRLPHLSSFEFVANWPKPTFTTPMKDIGYDVSDNTDMPRFSVLLKISML